MLVLKHILGGSLKITSEDSNNLERQKIASKDALGSSTYSYAGSGLPQGPFFGNQYTQLSQTQFDKITTRYEYWEVFVPSTCVL